MLSVTALLQNSTVLYFSNINKITCFHCKAFYSLTDNQKFDVSSIKQRTVNDSNALVCQQGVEVTNCLVAR